MRGRIFLAHEFRRLPMVDTVSASPSPVAPAPVAGTVAPATPSEISVLVSDVKAEVAKAEVSVESDLSDYESDKATTSEKVGIYATLAVIAGVLLFTLYKCA
jgi:hypothetical protein